MPAMNSGTIAMSRPVTDEWIHCSPIEIAANGMTNSISANTSTAPPWPRSCDSAPRRQAMGSRMTTASVRRAHAMNSGSTSSSAILMRK